MFQVLRCLINRRSKQLLNCKQIRQLIIYWYMKFRYLKDLMILDKLFTFNVDLMACMNASVGHFPFYSNSCKNLKYFSHNQWTCDYTCNNCMRQYKVITLISIIRWQIVIVKVYPTHSIMHFEEVRIIRSFILKCFVLMESLAYIPRLIWMQPQGWVCTRVCGNVKYMKFLTQIPYSH